MYRYVLLEKDMCYHQGSVTNGIIGVTTYSCHRNGHRKCKFGGGNETECPFYESHNEHYQREWNEYIEEVKRKAESLFPYETEESCPIAFERISKNKCIDCIRAGYVRGYVDGEDNSYKGLIATA